MRAIVVAGGSWHGLSAVTGVADEIRTLNLEGGGRPEIAGVVGAIINDIGPEVARRRFSAVTPDGRLGAAALRAARPGRFLLGARGAGRFAMSGLAVGEGEFSGQGGAYRQLGPTKVAVFTVVNAGGLVVDREGRVVRCRSMRSRGSCGTIAEVLARRLDAIVANVVRETGAAPEPPPGGPSDHTTITLVVTNQKLDWWALQWLATQVHTSMARAIQPFATRGDGDVLYAASTGEIDNPRLAPPALALVASEVAWDAVLSSVPPPEASSDTSAIAVAADALDAFVGEYALGPGSRMSVRRDGLRLVAESAHGGQYVPAGRPIALLPVAGGEFVLESSRRDRLRFEADATGQITRLTINPGPWALLAPRAAPTR
jgi:L-aminopeptidase/D-esterase-like protein